MYKFRLGFALCAAVLAYGVLINSDFDTFVEEIEEFINASDSYVLPTNKDSYFSDENDTGSPTGKR